MIIILHIVVDWNKAAPKMFGYTKQEAMGMHARDLILTPEIRAIASSGYSTNPIMSKFENYGFKGALPKPYTIDNLSDILARIIK